MPKVATKIISTMGQKIVGLRTTYCRASRICPFAATTGRDLVSSWVRISTSASTAMAEVPALIAIDHPDPTTVMSTPLMAGPSNPPRWKMLAFNVIALRRRCEPTISVTKAERDGESTAIEHPVIAATTNTSQACATPTSTSTASSPLNTVPTDWVMISVR